jgi:pyrroloquinoline-quinone synthase
LVPVHRPESQPVGVQEFARELLAVVEQELRSGRDPLLAHLRKGPLPSAALGRWAAQYYLFVREFARFLSAVHSRCPDFEARALIAENIYEEHGRFAEGRDHPALMRRFGRAIGLTDDAMEAASPLPETAAYIDTLFRLTQAGSYLEGLAAVGLGVEAVVPRYFALLEPLLRERYGLTVEDTEFFRVHLTDDVEHAERALAIIATHACARQAQAAVTEAVRATQAARARFRDAVYQAAVAATAS